jgi:hypothetical protein
VSSETVGETRALAGDGHFAPMAVTSDAARGVLNGAWDHRAPTNQEVLAMHFILTLLVASSLLPGCATESYRVADGTDEIWFWRRHDNRAPTDSGTFDNGKLVSRAGDERVVHASATEFRAWFPRYVRDDVMSFVIAELAR